MSDSRERGKRSKLWLIEHVVEPRWSITDGARRTAGSIVPDQLQGRVVGDFQTTDGFRRDKRVGRLRRCQRSISPKSRHVREQVVEVWNVRNRRDFASC